MERVSQFTRLLTEIGLSGLIDITIVALVLYAFLVALKRAKRSGLVLTGIFIVSIIYLAARKFDLVLTVALLQGFFAVILVALVVIFQEELRYFFERVGLWWRDRRLPMYKQQAARLQRREGEILARTLSDLARARIGALVVLRGRDVIVRHLEGGEELQGQLSEPLLKSIFDPHSLGHDGAVVVEGDRIAKFGVHLPLSHNLDKLPRSGTRHAAALGISERTDALCLVVSEERGTISTARHGDITPITDSAELAQRLKEFYDEVLPRRPRQPWKDFFKRSYREKALALGLAVGLWIVVVHRSQVVQRSFLVSVQPAALNTNLVIRSVNPEAVQVTFSAPRKEFDFLRPGDIKLTLQLWDVGKGVRVFQITGNDLTYPHNLLIDGIEPRQVSFDVAEKLPEQEAR